MQTHAASGRRRAGFSLVEMAVAATLVATIASFSIPMFSKAIEQSRVDEAAIRLQVIWTGQRLYWLKYHTYADSLVDLEAEGYVDRDASRGIGDLDFDYSLDATTESAYTVWAAPPTKSRWSGALRIDERGEIGGEIRRPGRTLKPSHRRRREKDDDARKRGRMNN
jgi:prepilin-type N-terminal cleavage/methylation domain-containing protein